MAHLALHVVNVSHALGQHLMVKNALNLQFVFVINAQIRMLWTNELNGANFTHIYCLSMFIKSHS